MTTELYIGNVAVTVSTEEARQAIVDLGIDVIEFETIRRHNHFQSFRLRIRKADLETVKNPDIWPDGIVVRRFFRGKTGNGGVGTAKVSSTDGNAITQSTRNG